MPRTPDPDKKRKKIVRRLMQAVEQTVSTLEELKRASAALSLEATRPEFKLSKQEEDTHDDD
jgi:hypothetical protein